MPSNNTSFDQKSIVVCGLNSIKVNANKFTMAHSLPKAISVHRHTFAVAHETNNINPLAVGNAFDHDDSCRNHRDRKC